MLSGKEIAAGTLRSRLGAMAEAKPDIEVFIQADQSVPYGFVAQVMAEVKQAKINKVGLVTQPTENGAAL
jgi:biopolymer transport protein TolR